MDGPSKTPDASLSGPARSRVASGRTVKGPRSGRLPDMNQPAPRADPIDASVLDRASRVIRVLGHPLRLRLLELLEGSERNVTELVLATGVNQAVVSQQLRILRAEQVVGDRRDGPRVFYRITEAKVGKILDCIRECDIPEIVEPAASVGPALRIVSGSADRVTRRPVSRTTRSQPDNR